ncbi:MAG: methyltransferase domain-containing protein [Deltaproteobacteria bacterium]|nr:methyltransferase domain-containing protein [Deltaproteobacteria bacterium]
MKGFACQRGQSFCWKIGEGATTFDVPGRFDFITDFDAICDQARPDSVLAGICKSLKSGGVFLMQDIAASSQVYKITSHPGSCQFNE